MAFRIIVSRTNPSRGLVCDVKRDGSDDERRRVRLRPDRPTAIRLLRHPVQDIDKYSTGPVSGLTSDAIETALPGSVFPCRNTVTSWSGVTRLPLRGQYRHCEGISPWRTDFPFHPSADRLQGTLCQW